MTHQPFEDWLFFDEPLTAEQSAALQEHLRGCESCRAISSSWQAVEGQLRAVTPAEPEPGFSSRWQARLEADRRRLHHRQSLAALGFSIGGAAMLLISILVLAWPLLRSPSLLLLTVLYRLLTLVTLFLSVEESLSALFQAAAGSVPLVWWILILGVLSQLAVLWVVAFRLLTNPRRVSNENR